MFGKGDLVLCGLGFWVASYWNGNLDFWGINTPSLGMQIPGGKRGLVFHEVMADCAVMVSRMDLREEVPVVIFARGPRDGVVAALDSVADPVVAHVDGFRSLEANSLVLTISTQSIPECSSKTSNHSPSSVESDQSSQHGAKQ